MTGTGTGTGTGPGPGTGTGTGALPSAPSWMDAVGVASMAELPSLNSPSPPSHEARKLDSAQHYPVVPMADAMPTAPMSRRMSSAPSWMDAIGVAPTKPLPSLNLPLPPRQESRNHVESARELELVRHHQRIGKVVESHVHQWAMLRALLERRGPSVMADGAASEHGRAARDEAARKLIMNHERVLFDLTNTAPLTQESLRRVSASHADLADEALAEVARRLLGRTEGSHEALLLDTLLEKQLDMSCGPMVQAWSSTAEYLIGRLHSETDQMPTRTPDMSSAAGLAMKAVLHEVGVLHMQDMLRASGALPTSPSRHHPRVALSASPFRYRPQPTSTISSSAAQETGQRSSGGGSSGGCCALM